MLFEYWLKLQEPFIIPRKYKLTSEDLSKISYEFLPLHISKDNDKYTCKINFAYFNDNSYKTPCYFIEKAKLRLYLLELPLNVNYMLGTNPDFYTFSGKVALTANTLWQNSLNYEAYQIIWIYSLAKQLLDNFGDTNIRTDDKDSTKLMIRNLINQVMFYANDNKIELPQHTKQGKLILPKGLMFQKSYTSNYIKTPFDLISVLFLEMTYIKANYQLCVIDNEVEKSFMENLYESVQL